MTGAREPTDDDAREIAYLVTPRAIRERAEAIYALCRAGQSAHFALDETRLAPLADRVVAVTRAAYPDVAAIPYHSRWRHFAVGGIDRLASIETKLASFSPYERLVAELDLVIVSVLLDAGAGERWSFRESASGQTFTRSEGLAVASWHLFREGNLSARSGDPLRADAATLGAIDEAAIGRAFQASDGNPLVGLTGRAAVLRRLGDVVQRTPRFFGDAQPRPGHLGRVLLGEVREGKLPARRILAAVLEALGPIWPGRARLGGVSLGDVWNHPRAGWVPFHKLSQWLSYSLCEPLERAGVAVVDLDELTGLAEYRNGGLFVDGGVLRPKHEAVTTEVHAVGSEVVVEWRALTVALLDRLAVEVRRSLGLSQEQLPLAKVLEGGTWSTGRVLAREKRSGGAPPIQVDSDGTVF